MCVSPAGNAVWEQSWLTGRCSRAPVFTLAFKQWACGRCCWRKEFSTTVSQNSPVDRTKSNLSVCVHVKAGPFLNPLCSLFVGVAVDQELTFQDKYLFYRFLEDEQEDAPLPTEEETRESDEELQDTLLLLSQVGPDAHMRMILRKQ